MPWLCIGHTHAHASNIRSGVVEKRYHMSPLRHRALEARVKCIAGKKGEKFWFVGVLGRMTVLVDNGLETGWTSDGFCGTGSKGTKSARYSSFP